MGNVIIMPNEVNEKERREVREYSREFTQAGV